MDDLVAYKVYTFWSEGGKPEVRRFGIEKSVVTSFQYLNAKLQDVFPGLRSKSYIVTWKDEEQDDITISSDEEVIAALAAITPNSNIIKLNIYCKDDGKDDDIEVHIAAHVDGPSGAAGPNNMVHYGVTCDACDSEVVGFRYKCISCDDYDLCAACESNGMHREHCMLRVPVPTLPRTVIKAAIKRSRHFLKSVVGPVGEDCAYKRHRRGGSGDRKHRGMGDGHGDHREHHREHRDHHRRQRTSWLETFATYMNEFANLAGDAPVVDLTGESKKDAQSQAKAAAKEASTSTAQQPTNAQANAQENAQNSTPTNQQPNTSNTQNTCPVFPGNINVQNIQKLIDMYMGGRLNFSEFLREETAAASASASNASASSASASNANASATANADVDMGVTTQNNEDNVSVSSTQTRGSDDNREASAEKVDGWTVINNDKDLAEEGVPAPIGFNLPQEFHERVMISERQSLYPPLNTATAEADVLAPTAPSAPPSQAPPQASAAQGPHQAPTSQASAAQALPPTHPAQATPQPRLRHPKPHIDAAIQQMLAMGFTNEGGWLTHVLESKDGNISAVLDLLTPVQKK